MRLLSLPSLRGLPVMCITFWFNTYSTINVFSFSASSIERISGLEGDFVFNYISLPSYSSTSTVLSTYMRALLSLMYKRFSADFYYSFSHFHTSKSKMDFFFLVSGEKGNTNSKYKAIVRKFENLCKPDFINDVKQWQVGKYVLCEYQGV